MRVDRWLHLLLMGTDAQSSSVEGRQEREDEITSLPPPPSSQMATQSILSTRDSSLEVTPAISGGGLCESNHHPQKEKPPEDPSGLEAKCSLIAFCGGTPLRAKFISHDSLIMSHRSPCGRGREGPGWAFHKQLWAIGQ